MLSRRLLAVYPAFPHGKLSALPAFRWRAISGGRRKKLLPYRSAKAVHHRSRTFPQRTIVLGIVSQNTYPQALTGLSWLSYFPLYFYRRRLPSSNRYYASPHSKSPRLRRCTVRLAADAGPVGRICTCFVCDGPPCGGSVRVAQLRFTHRIECQDYSFAPCDCVTNAVGTHDGLL